MERKTGFEPATPTLARWCSTTELLPHYGWATRIRTWAHGTKTRCLTAWLWPNIEEIRGRPVGIEPTNAGATIRCVNHFAPIAIKEMAGVVGIEPTSKVLETFVLPLNYTPILIWWRGRDSNSRTRKGADLQSAAFSHFATPPSNK